MSNFLLSNLANHSEFGNEILEAVMTYFFFLDRFPLVSFMLKTLRDSKLVHQGLNNFHECEFPFCLNVGSGSRACPRGLKIVVSKL